MGNPTKLMRSYSMVQVETIKKIGPLAEGGLVKIFNRASRSWIYDKITV